MWNGGPVNADRNRPGRPPAEEQRQHAAAATQEAALRPPYQAATQPRHPVRRLGAPLPDLAPERECRRAGAVPFHHRLPQALLYAGGNPLPVWGTRSGSTSPRREGTEGHPAARRGALLLPGRGAGRFEERDSPLSRGRARADWDVTPGGARSRALLARGTGSAGRLWHQDGLRRAGPPTCGIRALQGC